MTTHPATPDQSNPGGKTPEALRLAEALGEYAKALPAYGFTTKTLDGAAAELRRQNNRLGELEAARMAYASEFPLAEDGEPDVGNIHANIRKLKAQVSAAQPQAGAESYPPSDAEIEDFLAARMTPEGRVPMIATIRAALAHWDATAALRARGAVPRDAVAMADVWRQSAEDCEASHGGVSADYHKGLADGMRQCAKDLLAAAPQAPASTTSEQAEAPVTLMTEYEASTWAWDQVRQEVGTEGWTTGDSCNFFGFFLHGWRYRGQYELQRPATLDRAAPASGGEAPAEGEAREFFAVLAPCGEGVLFPDSRDARRAATGRGRGSHAFGHSTLGEEFREIYRGEKLEQVTVRVMAAKSQKGGAA